jgi:hypothetical protein
MRDDTRVHVVVGLAGLALVLLMLAEFFVALLLPRRVKRDPRIARQIYSIVWPQWRAIARRMSPATGDSWLGVFGPLGLLLMVSALVFGLLVGFAALQWGAGSKLTGTVNPGFGDDLYFSAGSLFSHTTSLQAVGTLPRALGTIEAVAGFLVLASVIGYLPALFQAFSRREVAVSQLDPRAGSPPSAGRLITREVERGGDWGDLDGYMREWEVWAAELMETHLSYPLLAFYRSQHVNQNWVAALTCVVDTSAFVIAGAPRGSSEGALLTYAIGRHAFVDLTSALRARPVGKREERLDEEAFTNLRNAVVEGGLPIADAEPMQKRLTRLRVAYEPYAFALAHRLALALPPWLPPEEQITRYWRVSGVH